ncbi:hypothetical protein Q8F55_002522 [Vanrija albida]|uniref:Uncharacterized protein n=1 Tax=Vanrija albida TaxID=181172 RepID=A0ABR3QA91_9TREE
MKLALGTLLLAASALAAPADSSPAALEDRAGLELTSSLDTRQQPCYAQSGCSWYWSGGCEQYCRKQSRYFTYMSWSDCSWRAKRCCCTLKKY